MNTILEALNDVFGFDEPPALTADSKLQDIPDWDSMNAVNLLMRLESRTGKSLKGLKLTGQMTLGQLEAALRATGATV
jgi:acyl carrier protein